MNLEAILYIQYYKSDNASRQSEIDSCLLNNIENENICKIYLLNETLIDIPNLPKCEQIVIGERIQYKHALKHSLKHAGNICILANSDITFDESLNKLYYFNFDNVFIALARHELVDDILIQDKWSELGHSQDVWIWKSPIIDFKSDFTLGYLGCDNRIAAEAYKSGLKVINPALDIMAIHCHNSVVRNYSELNRIHGDCYFCANNHLI